MEFEKKKKKTEPIMACYNGKKKKLTLKKSKKN